MIQNTKTKLADFIFAIRGGREAGLAIARDESELASLAQEIEALGFSPTQIGWDLFGASETVWIPDAKMGKDVYDFAVQYPTGQVEIFDPEAMRPHLLSPAYDTDARIILATKARLAQWRKEGFDLLAVAGPAYQS